RRRNRWLRNTSTRSTWLRAGTSATVRLSAGAGRAKARASSNSAVASCIASKTSRSTSASRSARALPTTPASLRREVVVMTISNRISLDELRRMAVALKYGDRAHATRQAAGKDTGTVRFDDGAVTVIADLPKRVDWDQDKLAA